VIKCILWGNAVSSSLATNTGQWRGSDFQVVIAGSNGYTKYGFPLPAGYVAPADLGTAAIQAPLDCSGYDTYLGVRIFTDVPFDPDLCAAACTAQSEYNRAHPPINADGSAGYVQTCQFFDTYMLLKNGKPQFQECALVSPPPSSPRHHSLFSEIPFKCSCPSHLVECMRRLELE